MHLRCLRRRPSASMVVALLALFASLGGVGYAAIQLPSGSVGSAQLRNASVTKNKIANGSVSNFKLAFSSVGARKLQDAAVGKSQINANQVQARVAGTCTSGAIGSVSSTGTVTCNPTTPLEYDGSSPSPVSVPATTLPATSATPIASEPLPGGSSYLVMADPYVHITNTTAGQEVAVACTLVAGPTTAATETRTATVTVGATAADQSTSIPLVVTAPTSTSSITASVVCSQATTPSSPSPAVTITSNLNALQTASNTTATAAR